ncbi:MULTISPECIES: hypothetical protein [unclassified Nostoc]|uniref:hypothetical protein n=1 Tax=unclassified Nostoc TaxID=2593658 RepID=UPI00261337B3|nr:hypothetical protein [Nostoc sp. S13]MDF5737063.1 hypothetical protein [Nostoc sp. S13]
MLGFCDGVGDVYDGLFGVAKAQFGKLAKTYSSNVVNVVRPVEAASLQYESLLRIKVANLL